MIRLYINVYIYTFFFCRLFFLIVCVLLTQCVQFFVSSSICISLSASWTVTHKAVRAVVQARILEWLTTPFSRDLSDPGSNPCLPDCRQILYCLSHLNPLFLLQILFPYSVLQNVEYSFNSSLLNSCSLV